VQGWPARVVLAPDAQMGITWARDVGARLAAIAMSDRDVDWPATADGGAEAISGAGIAAALADAGAPSVELGNERYDYPAEIPSPWLDDVAGGAPTTLAEALKTLCGSGNT
jgi:hypothetical protein